MQRDQVSDSENCTPRLSVFQRMLSAICVYAVTVVQQAAVWSQVQLVTQAVTAVSVHSSTGFPRIVTHRHAF